VLWVGVLGVGVRRPVLSAAGAVQGGPPTAQCSRCRVAYYCNAFCLRQHWHEHKPDCLNIVGRGCIKCDNATCRKPSPPVKCTRCQLVYYCNAKCQKQHWPVHKPKCIDLVSQLVDQAWKRAPVSETPDIPRLSADEMPCGLCLAEEASKPVVLLGCDHAFCFPCLWEYYKFLRVVSTVGDTNCASGGGNGYGSCANCRAEILDEMSAVIERALSLCVRAMREGSESSKFRKLAKDLLEENFGTEDGADPALSVCLGIFHLELLKNPQAAIWLFDFVLEGQDELIQKMKILEEIRKKITASDIQASGS